MKTLLRAPLVGALLLVVGCGNTSRMGPTGAGPMTDTVQINVARTSESNTVLQNLMAIPELSDFAAALHTAGLDGELSGPGPITVFAPVNRAFDDADLDDMDMSEADHMGMMHDALLHHVAEGKLTSGQMTEGMTLRMMAGDNVTVNTSSADRTSFNVDDADIIYPDIESSNGVIHLVNLVLLPTQGGEVDND